MIAAACGPIAAKASGMVAARDAGKPPERIRDDAEIRCGSRACRVERRVVIVGHRRHHQRAVRTERAAQRLDQAERPAFDRAHGAERGVNQQHAASFDSERAKLVGDGGSAELVRR